jgi:transposase-like protein
MKRQRVDRTELWQRIISEQEASGQSVRAFCGQHGHKEHSFYMWRKRLRKPSAMRFALVEANHTLPAMIEVALAGGEKLRVPCEASALRLVLGVLKEARV